MQDVKKNHQTNMIAWFFFPLPIRAVTLCFQSGIVSVTQKELNEPRYLLPLPKLDIYTQDAHEGFVSSASHFSGLSKYNT